MSSNWNEKKTRYNDMALMWEKKDDIQKLLTIVQSDAVDVFNTFLEYRFVLEFTSEQQHLLEKAPDFWSEVICALRFSLIMKTARIFDETKGAIGLKKVYDFLEQSKYRDNLKKELKDCRARYSDYQKYINDIKTVRDKIYAHNDKIEYSFWKNATEYDMATDVEFDGEFWKVLEEILIWVRDSVLSLRVLVGDGYPVNREIANDLVNMFKK